MARSLLAFTLIIFASSVTAQTTFKCGWTTYKTTAIIHEYTYSYTFQDSFKLFLADSTKTFVAQDSQATMTIDYPFHDNNTYKTANFYNEKKKLVKAEDYKDNLVQSFKEYKYDDKGRKIYQYEENKSSSNNYKKTFDYGTDKATGDGVINEVSSFNGRVEFYTKSYFDKNNQKYKEVRLNDNNKDIVHIENFYYNAVGKLRERSVFFPEFKVTKKFPEPGGDVPVKCFKVQPFNIAERPLLSNRISFMKKLLIKNMSQLFDRECTEFEYKFRNNDCEVLISTTKINNVKQVIFRYKEKVQ